MISSASRQSSRRCASPKKQNVDLVEIAPLAVPPVCKLMDYGKFRYREQKKAHEAKLKQKQIQVKEIKFRPGTDEGDYKIKLGKLIQFLDEGDKAKVTLRFRGREMAHKEFGERLLERVRKDLDAVGLVEQFPRLEGRQMVMVIAPKKKGCRRRTKPKAEAKPKKSEKAARRLRQRNRLPRTQVIAVACKRSRSEPPGVIRRRQKEGICPR